MRELGKSGFQAGYELAENTERAGTNYQRWCCNQKVELSTYKIVRFVVVFFVGVFINCN